jgi:hypothetical protein
MNIEMNTEPQDLLLEIIGEVKDFNELPGAIETRVWQDARVGDYSLQIRLESPDKAGFVLQALREMGLTSIGARLVEPRVLPCAPARVMQPKPIPGFRLARA